VVQEAVEKVVFVAGLAARAERVAAMVVRAVTAELAAGLALLPG
jgi:hypothetical protein